MIVVPISVFGCFFFGSFFPLFNIQVMHASCNHGRKQPLRSAPYTIVFVVPVFRSASAYQSNCFPFSFVCLFFRLCMFRSMYCCRVKTKKGLRMPGVFVVHLDWLMNSVWHCRRERETMFLLAGVCRPCNMQHATCNVQHFFFLYLPLRLISASSLVRFCRGGL